MCTRWISLAVAVTLVFVAAMGCSGSGSSIAPALQNDANIGQSGAGKTLPIGLYQFIVNKNTQEVDIVKLRGVEMTLNVLGFMEPPVLLNVSIDFDTLDIVPGDDYIGVDVIFRHPFITQNGDFMGFDVRGVVFGPQVTNADGYTPLVNPADFLGVPFGYIDGLLGAPNSVGNYDEEYWGYKYFADGLGLNEDLTEWVADSDNLDDRGKFGEGNENTRHYDLSWAGDGFPYDFFVFNYAVVASYDWPTGEPPFDLDSFSITTSNMAEAFCLTAYEVSNGLYHDGVEGGGSLDLDVEVWDWQTLDYTKVTVESIEPGILGPVTVDTYDPGSTSYSGIFHFVEVEGNPLTTGTIDLLLTATDESETYGSAWFLGLLPPGNDFYDEYVYSLQIFTVSVAAEEQELEMYWYPVEGQTGISLSPPPNQGIRNPDLGVFSEGDDQSRGTVVRQDNNIFNEWNDGYTSLAGTFPWVYGDLMKPFNHLDLSINGQHCQLITHSQTATVPPNPDSSFAAMLSTSNGYLPPFDGSEHLVWVMAGFDPTAYWLDIGDASGAVVGYDESSNGSDDNSYFVASYSTAPGNESQTGPHDGMYQFFRWISPYFDGTTLYLDQIGVYGMSTQDPVEAGPIDDTETREHRLGVDDNTGTYFSGTTPPHPETDWAEFFYIIDNQNWLHMCIVEFDDPITFIYVAGATEENWDGDIVDVEVAPAYTGTDPPLTGWGWSEVLIDKGDNTWTVMTLFWDISEDPLAVYILHETDPLPGTPLALDVDNTDFELHVLANNSGTIEATVFKWYDNIN